MPRDDADEHAASIRDRHKVLRGYEIHHILHFGVDAHRPVPHTALDLAHGHFFELLRRFAQQKAQEVPFPDRADVTPIMVDHRNRGKPAFHHIVKRLPHRTVVEQVRNLYFRFEKKRYVHMVFLRLIPLLLYNAAAFRSTVIGQYLQFIYNLAGYSCKS